MPLPPSFALVVGLHNAGLAEGAAALRSQGIDAEIVDMHRIGDEIVTDPRTFGLNPAYLDQPLVLGIGSQPMWDEAAQNWVLKANPAVAGVDPDQVAFMDFLHPSSATHGVLGSFAAASIGDNPVLLGDGDDVVRTGKLADLVLGGAGQDRISSRRVGPISCSAASATISSGQARAATSWRAAPATTGCMAALATTWWPAPTGTTCRAAVAAAT